MFQAFRRLGAQVKSTTTAQPARLQFEVLEDRQVPANFLVSNLNDAGLGSLRQAVQDANAAGTVDVIQFQAGLTGTITLTTGQLDVSDDVDIQGPGTGVITVSGNDASRVFYVSGAGVLDVTISGLTMTDGNAGGGNGGALYLGDENLTLDNVVISSSDGVQGGAIYANGGAIAIRNSTLSGNTATGDGGALYFHPDDDGPFILENSTVSGNTAGDDGGGIHLHHLYNASITNSTISGNTTGGKGGGVYIHHHVGPTNWVLSHSTISGNTATGQGGGLFLYFDAGLTLEHTILANNTSVGTPATNDLAHGAGEVLDASFNLIETAPPGGTINGINVGNIVGADPLLGPLASNFGPTQTHLLLPGSPAIDAGDPAFAPPPATDQHGLARVFNGRIDIGSVESQPLPLPPPPPPPAPAPLPGPVEPVCLPGDSDNTCFVKRLFVDLLGRRVDGDDAGLKYVTELDAGRSRQEVIEDVLHSREYLDQKVRELYQVVLGRDGDVAGVAFYTNLVRESKLTLEDVHASLIASDEFLDAHPGNQLLPAIVAAVPGASLPVNVKPPSGLDEVRQFALDLINSSGAVAVKIVNAYDQLLHRGTDETSFAWAWYLEDGSFNPVLIGIAGSDEYFQKV